jgi:predicted GIY-YIG superfamily endonuclease
MPIKPVTFLNTEFKTQGKLEKYVKKTIYEDIGICGYLYLIFHEKYEDQQLYKIGKTEDIIRRFKQHQKDYTNSKLISCAYCSNYHHTENLLINAFNQQFKCVKGREYFKGIYKDVRRIFNNITEPYITEPYITEQFTTELSWPPLKAFKYCDGSPVPNMFVENDDWKNITQKNLRHLDRFMIDFYVEDLWINAKKKEGEYIYDDPKCCFCKEFCTKNSSCSDRYVIYVCSFVFFEENRTLDYNNVSVPFCDKCVKEVHYNKGTDFYLFIRSYKYGKCILKPDYVDRGND